LTPSTFTVAASWSYGFALAAYTLFGLRVLLGWRRSTRAFLLAAALVASAVWAGASVWAVRTGAGAAITLMDGGDVVRYGLWLAFLANLMSRPSGGEGGPAPNPRLRRQLIAVVIAVLVGCLALSAGLPLAATLGASGTPVLLILRLGLAILGLTLIEQLMRRAHAHVRWGLRPLAVALGGIFGFDLFLYADAMLFSHVDADFWIARGAAHALVIPLLAVATARNTGWTVEMHLSRGAVFHSTALVVSGGFLLAVAAAGYLVRYLGGEWGAALQIELLFAAMLCVAIVATSGRFRSLLRVFVSKHFFSYRYDYREEWLRFTRTLSHESGPQRLAERVIMALADLVESPGGALWLRREDRGLEPAGRFNIPQPEAAEPVDGALARFLERTGWIVDVPHYTRDPSRYAGLQLPDWLAAMPSAWIVVPLVAGSELVGFVVLTTPRAPVKIDWEVRDLLKTASRQAASWLAQVRASEALLEARKFDAFNRMSAFVVHDLKNLVAQLSLLLRNAERHRDNPEFQRDMLSTVEHVMERMNGLMLQLRTGTTPVEKAHAVDLAPLVRRVVSGKTAPGRLLEIRAEGSVTALGHEDRLEHVVGHLVQNALDASRAGEPVRIAVFPEDGRAVVEVSDQGVGMSEEYVRERLCKPFETTKPSGMGIGVYESSQYVASVGGRLVIESSPGRGTRVRVVLQLPDTAVAMPHTELA
jgi:putative PEP-CTERM system histidine kinase